MAGRAPQVRLGALTPGGIAPSVYALVERGAGLRPRLAGAVRGEVELRYAEGFAPTRIAFGDDGVVVEDVDEAGGRPRAPDVVIVAPLAVLVQLAAAPLAGGVPKPTSARGRAALATVASGQVRVVGNRPLARRLLQVLAIS